MEFKDLPAQRFTKVDEFIKAWYADVLRQYDTTSNGREVPMEASTSDMIKEMHENFNLAVSHARYMMNTLSEVNRFCQPVAGDSVDVLMFKLAISELIKTRVTKL